MLDIFQIEQRVVLDIFPGRGESSDIYIPCRGGHNVGVERTVYDIFQVEEGVVLDIF